MKQLNWYQIFGKSNIPDGRTVLPTDDIQILLHCANIWDKTYTTLSELLADTDTLLAVISSNNAIDYLVRSTTWAASTTLVPKMTNYTTPSGVASASSEYSTNDRAWRAFDEDYTKIWAPSTQAVGQWVAYEFPSAVRVGACVVAGFDTRAPYSFKIQASNDNFNTIGYESDVCSCSNVKDTMFDLNTNDEYTKFRMYMLSWTSYISISKLQFYTPSITANSTAMALIGANNYASNTLLADATWCNAIVESEYWESVLSPLVPEMTSNTTPSGIASQYGTPSGSAFEAYKAFDRDNTSHAEATFTRNDTWHVRYEFPTAVKCYVGKYIAHNPSSSTFSFTMKMQRSADGVTWTDISGSTTQSISGGNTYSSGKIIFTSFDDAKYYQFCSQPNNYYAAGATEVQFYGREDV